MELTPMETLLATFGTVVTGAIGWVGDVVTTVTGNPLLLLSCGLALTGVAIGFFKSLR